MPESRTGPIRISGYAIKLRRVVNAALRDYYKEKKLDAKEVNQILSDVNAKIYNVLVDRFNLPKETIVNIILNYDVVENKLVVKDVKVEVYELDELLTKITTTEVKKALNIPT